MATNRFYTDVTSITSNIIQDVRDYNFLKASELELNHSDSRGLFGMVG